MIIITMWPLMYKFNMLPTLRIKCSLVVYYTPLTGCVCIISLHLSLIAGCWCTCAVHAVIYFCVSVPDKWPVFLYAWFWRTNMQGVPRTVLG